MTPRTASLLLLSALALAACGKKGEPEPPSGKQAPTRSYPAPEPTPWQVAPPPATPKT
ncbi:MAG: hypothetical protein IPK81_04975 [Rhodospirillales bacterium]|nr:MAG: hypothetical protein IPK81_04975 [Rhodospirillales bacterium]